MNMVNWVKEWIDKGVCGNCSSVFRALAFSFYSSTFQRSSCHHEFVTMGRISGFFLEFYPQKLPGYGAGSLAGYMLAVISILSFGKLGTILLVLALPLTDATIVFRRLIHKNHRLKRIEHIFIMCFSFEIGVSITIFYWAISYRRAYCLI